jgi:hypothetical protein
MERWNSLMRHIHKEYISSCNYFGISMLFAISEPIGEPMSSFEDITGYVTGIFSSRSNLVDVIAIPCSSKREAFRDYVLELLTPLFDDLVRQQKDVLLAFYDPQSEKKPWIQFHSLPQSSNWNMFNKMEAKVRNLCQYRRAKRQKNDSGDDGKALKRRKMLDNQIEENLCSIHPEEWSIQMVIEWIKTLELSCDYSEAFRRESVDGKVLQMMNEKHWQELVPIMGHRVVITTSLKKITGIPNKEH